MGNTFIQGTDLNSPLNFTGVAIITTLTGTNVAIASGGSILPAISGANIGGSSIGSVAKPFASIFSATGTYTNIISSVISGTTISGLNYVVASGGSILPAISGTGVGGVSIGSPALPFSGLYSKTFNGQTTITRQSNEIPTGSINGANTQFYLSYAPYNYGLELFKGGIYMLPSGIGSSSWDYVLSGTGITFTVAPASGITLVANYNYLA